MTASTMRQCFGQSCDNDGDDTTTKFYMSGCVIFVSTRHHSTATPTMAQAVAMSVTEDDADLERAMRLLTSAAAQSQAEQQKAAVEELAKRMGTQLGLGSMKAEWHQLQPRPQKPREPEWYETDDVLGAQHVLEDMIEHRAVAAVDALHHLCIQATNRGALRVLQWAETVRQAYNLNQTEARYDAIVAEAARVGNLRILQEFYPPLRFDMNARRALIHSIAHNLEIVELWCTAHPKHSDFREAVLDTLLMVLYTRPSAKYLPLVQMLAKDHCYSREVASFLMLRVLGTDPYKCVGIYDKEGHLPRELQSSVARIIAPQIEAGTFGWFPTCLWAQMAADQETEASRAIRFLASECNCPANRTW